MVRATGSATFYYEADTRNTGSMKLLLKFDEKYEIIEQGLESLTTDSGKDLKLQGYILKEPLIKEHESQVNSQN